MTLIKCTTDVPKERFAKSQNHVRSPYKVQCSWSVPANCGYISAKTHHTVTHLSKLVSRLKATSSYNSGSCIHNLPQTSISTFSLQWNHAWSNIWEVADSKVTRKWRLLFVDGRDARASLVSTVTAFLNSSHDEANASECQAIRCKLTTLQQNQVATFATAKISHLI